MPAIGALVRTGWIVTADGYASGAPALQHIVDADPGLATFLVAANDTLPWEIVIDMITSQEFNAFTYTPRQDVSLGRIKGYELYATDDTGTWGVDIAAGEFENLRSQQIVQFGSRITARFLKIKVLTTWSGRAAIADVTVGLVVGSGGMVLTCVCEGTSGVTICQLSELWFEGTNFEVINGKSASVSFLLTGGAIPYAAPTPRGNWSIAMSLGDASGGTWEALSTEATVAASLNQPPEDGKSYLWGVHCWIRQVYTCVDSATGTTTSHEVKSYPTVTGNCECFDGVLRVTAYGEGGSLYASSPLGACQGCTAGSGDFEPKPEPNSIDLTGKDATKACLCVTGGVPPYKFYVAAGSLPKGTTLDPSSGCLQGTPQSSGTAVVTYAVVDSAGNVAEADCNLFNSCFDGSDSGFGNWQL